MLRILLASLLPSSMGAFSPLRSNGPQPRSLPRRLSNFFSSMLEDSRIDYSTLKGRPRSLGFEAGSWAMKGEVPVKSEDGYEVATFAGGCFCELARLKPRGCARTSPHHPSTQAAPHSCSRLASSFQLRLLHTHAHRRGHRAALPAATRRHRYLRRVHAGQAHRVWRGPAHVQGGLLREDGAYRGGPGHLQALRSELRDSVREADEHHRPDAAQPGGPNPNPNPDPDPDPSPSSNPSPSPSPSPDRCVVLSEGAALVDKAKEKVAWQLSSAIVSAPIGGLLEPTPSGWTVHEERDHEAANMGRRSSSPG